MKSNDDWSPFYDPKFTMQITINGQMFIAMLGEALADLGCTILQANTDGITIKCKKTDFHTVEAICAYWEEYTKLSLEYKHYTKMVIKDVNSYCAIDTKGDVKRKGAFKLNSEYIRDAEYHKDFSFNIVRLALSEYFVNGVSIEDTIRKSTNIYDFTGKFKAKSDSGSEIRYIEDGKMTRQRMQKTNRYYIANKGATYMKIYSTGEEEHIQKGYQVKIFNNYEENTIEGYGINYVFYEKECRKILNVIENKQVDLFDLINEM